MGVVSLWTMAGTQPPDPSLSLTSLTLNIHHDGAGRERGGELLLGVHHRPRGLRLLRHRLPAAGLLPLHPGPHPNSSLLQMDCIGHIKWEEEAPRSNWP